MVATKTVNLTACLLLFFCCGLFAAKSAGPGAARANSAEFFSRITKPNTTDMIAGSGGPINVRGTLDRIAAGEKFPHRNDGSIFGNREGLLPSQPSGYYKEYVHPTPGGSGPGAQRIIIGEGGDAFFTPDHYKSFIPLN